MSLTTPPKKSITDETIAIIAEKGLRAARLNSVQTKELFNSRLPEVYALWDMAKEPVKPLEKNVVDRLMDRFFPEVAVVGAEIPSLVVRLRDVAAELIGTVSGWNIGSPVFVCRAGAESQRVMLHREIGRVTVHIEVVSRAARLADIRLCLTDESNRDATSFEVELLQNGRCIEASSGRINKTVLFRRVETGEYLLRLSDEKGEITSLRIGMES
jgi:hypothetical protein